MAVSENRRFLVRPDGSPFCWFADTAWELFHRLTREEAAYYLEKRTEQGFTLIQAVVLAEFDGIRQPNAYGAPPCSARIPPPRMRLISGTSIGSWRKRTDSGWSSAVADLGRQGGQNPRGRSSDLHPRERLGLR